MAKSQPYDAIVLNYWQVNRSIQHQYLQPWAHLLTKNNYLKKVVRVLKHVSQCFSKTTVRQRSKMQLVPLLQNQWSSRDTVLQDVNLAVQPESRLLHHAWVKVRYRYAVELQPNYPSQIGQWRKSPKLHLHTQEPQKWMTKGFVERNHHRVQLRYMYARTQKRNMQFYNPYLPVIRLIPLVRTLLRKV